MLIGTRRPGLTRGVIALMALLLFFLSMARLANDELRRATKAEAHLPVTDPHAIASPRISRAPGGAGAQVAHVAAKAARPSFPRPTSDAKPVGMPAGASAVGTTLPKRKRWAAIGGHGRHGAG